MDDFTWGFIWGIIVGGLLVLYWLAIRRKL